MPKETEYWATKGKKGKYFLDFETARKYARKHGMELFQDTIQNGLIIDSIKLYSPEEDD
jgi:hypothetical protein